jgi:hypothetical protein
MPVIYRDHLTWHTPKSYGASTLNSFFLVAGTIPGGWGATHTLPTNYVICAPFATGYSITVDRMGIEVIAAGSKTTLGIYSVGTGFLPASLMASVVVSVANNGVRTGVFTSPVSLAAQSTYWLAIWTQEDFNLNAIGQTTLYPTFGYVNVNNAFMAAIGLVSVVDCTGLPNPFPINSATFISSPSPALGLSIQAVDWTS